MEDYDISENCKNKDFIRFVAALSLGMLFCLCIGCFSWASKSLNNRASSSVLLVDESLVSDS